MLKWGKANAKDSISGLSFLKSNRGGKIHTHRGNDMTIWELEDIVTDLVVLK